jgi:hypothetical protein
MRRPGDCVLLRGRVWHASVPSEPNRIMFKLVVFFEIRSDARTLGRTCTVSTGSVGCTSPAAVTPGAGLAAGQDKKPLCDLSGDDGVGAAARAREWLATCGPWSCTQLKLLDDADSPVCPAMLQASLNELVCAWDERGGLREGAAQLWTPYDQYDKVNCSRVPPGGNESEGGDEDGSSSVGGVRGVGGSWQLDQMRNVRRVMNHQLPRLAVHESMRATATLVESLRSACERVVRQVGVNPMHQSGKGAEYKEGVGHGEGVGLRVYDLHFLRQRGTNAASFSPHQDLHDTGDASTTRVAAAVSILVGGWEEPIRRHPHVQ